MRHMPVARTAPAGNAADEPFPKPCYLTKKIRRTMLNRVAMEGKRIGVCAREWSAGGLYVRDPWFPMSIRKKAVFGLAVSLLVVVFVGIFFFHNLSVIQTKQHVVEIADDLSNIVLEIRRYEKNYLLYASEKISMRTTCIYSRPNGFWTGLRLRSAA